VLRLAFMGNVRWAGGGIESKFFGGKKSFSGNKRQFKNIYFSDFIFVSPQDLN